ASLGRPSWRGREEPYSQGHLYDEGVLQWVAECCSGCWEFLFQLSSCWRSSGDSSGNRCPRSRLLISNAVARATVDQRLCGHIIGGGIRALIAYAIAATGPTARWWAGSWYLGQRNGAVR